MHSCISLYVYEYIVENTNAERGLPLGNLNPNSGGFWVVRGGWYSVTLAQTNPQLLYRGGWFVLRVMDTLNPKP